MTGLELIGLLGSIASIIGLLIAVWYLPTLINWRKIKKSYKQYLKPKLLSNNKYFVEFNEYYFKADKEERIVLREAALRYAPPFHRDLLISIMNMVDSQEAIESNK